MLAKSKALLVGLAVTFSAASWGSAKILLVGPGKTFASVTDAYAAANPGDTIEVFPAETGAYESFSLKVDKPSISFVGVGGNVVLSGKGGDESGVGSAPRAIFEFGPMASNGSVSGFVLKGAHNQSHNAAGVRINQAKGVHISQCEIVGNDMGIMSNGDGVDRNSASGQLISHCKIHGNGDFGEPGQNHNLYLGGCDVTVEYCEIYGSLTGHDFKSRAHFNLIRFNVFHDAANRELDLVDSWYTNLPNSNSVVAGNVIFKKVATEGNGGVVHFGADGADVHNGKLFAFNNTIVTTYPSPVFALDGKCLGLRLVNNLVVNQWQHQADFVSVAGGVEPKSITGGDNWVSAVYRQKRSDPDLDSLFFGDQSRPPVTLTTGSFADWREGAMVGPIGPDPQLKLSYEDGDGRVTAFAPTQVFAFGRGWVDSMWTKSPFIGG